MRKKTYSLIALLCVITFASFGQADTASKKSKYHFWLNGSAHLTFSDNFDFMTGLGLGLNFSINQTRFFQLKGYGLFSLDGLPMSSPKANELLYLTNVSALYGVGRYRTQSFLIITSAGLSYGEAYYRGKYLYTAHSGSSWNSSDTPVYDKDIYNYIGLPLNLSFMLTSPFIGISIDVYANIHKHPDYGITVNKHIGKIRDRKTKHI